jgi:ATP-binding cassette, subfamily B, bacterial MsbA
VGVAKNLKSGEWALVRLLREAIPGNRLRLLWAFACMGAVAASSAGVAWAMKDAINLVLVSRDAVALLALPALIFLLSAIRGLADYGQSVTVARIGSSAAAALQVRLFRAILSFEQSFFDNKRSGRLAARVNTNVRMAKQALVTLATTVGRDALTVLALGLVMVLTDPLLAIVGLVAAPMILFGMTAIARRAKGLSREELEGSAVIQGIAQETFQGIRTVRALTLETTVTQQFEHAVRSVEKKSNKVARLTALGSPLGELAGGLIIAATILYVGWADSTRSPGEVMSFITAFLLAFQPAKRLMNVQVTLVRGSTAVSKLYEMLDAPTASLATPAIRLPALRGDIAFKDVSFGYDKHHEVISGISFEAHPGEMVALVGRSGVGKSTIFSLLQMLYRPTSGTIEVDGISLANVDATEFRRQLSVVSQHTTLFARTVRENIRLARPEASDGEVERACRDAGALDFIESLPAGFDTFVGEQGLTLSGGQVQRLSMARALLRDAPVLLLDEATAALDMETADWVLASLARHSRARTVLNIAHRPAMIEASTRVLVMAHGQLVASGTPSDLRVSSKEYRNLVGHDLPSQLRRGNDA